MSIFVQGQGVRKILPQAGLIFEDKIFRETTRLDEKAIFHGSLIFVCSGLLVRLLSRDLLLLQSISLFAVCLNL